MKLPPEILSPLVNNHAILNNLRADIVMCIILQESGADTFANRFEPAFYDKYLKDKSRNELTGFVPPSIPTLITEKHNRATSWGLMQVMGETARWCAKVTAPYLTTLCDPDRGIDAGCRVLSYYLGLENEDYPRALARYNAGNPNSPVGRQYADIVANRVIAGEHLKYFNGR